ncbi:MAG: RNB domain-containing ribonuclease, partial [Ruthenibacterium sp.]
GEAKLVIDEAGHCVDVVKRTRGESEQLIEELMLMANECAAKRAREANIPFVYRVHEKPAPERIETLEKALTSADVEYHFANGIPTQPELAVLLTKARGTSLERFVHTNVLRSMAKAKYEPAPKGHFGLALEDYAHFTSPIRRYPDLAIHRILTDLYAGMDTETLNKKYMGFAAGASLQASDCEVIAMQAERAAEDCYKAEYMRQFIGDEFDSVISSVTSFGVYVELPNTVEGLVRAASLSDRPLLLTEGVCLADAASGRTWRLGDTLRVRLTAVDVSHGNLDFEPVI